MALRLYGEGAAADTSSALLGVPHLVIFSAPRFGQTPCLQLDLEVVPDAVSPELAAGLRRRARGGQGQAIGRIGDRSERPETQDRDHQQSGGHRDPESPPARRTVVRLVPGPRQHPILELRRRTTSRCPQDAVGVAYLLEVFPAVGAMFQVTFQFPLFRTTQLAQHVRAEELLEAILTHHGPPSVRS